MCPTPSMCIGMGKTARTYLQWIPSEINPSDFGSRLWDAQLRRPQRVVLQSCPEEPCGEPEPGDLADAAETGVYRAAGTVISAGDVLPMLNPTASKDTAGMA